MYKVLCKCIAVSSSVQCQVQGGNAEQKCKVSLQTAILNIKAAKVETKEHSQLSILLIFISLHLLLRLRAGVSFLAAALVLVQCSCGVRLLSRPALQSLPW